MMDDDSVLHITPKGRLAIARGDFPDDMDDETKLFALVIAKTEASGITMSNCMDICDQLVDRYDGDYQRAIDAVVSKTIDLKRLGDH